ncbi:MAG: hypothetical protein ACOC8Y_04170 [Candidatus Natronoplasma sp.]
MFISEKDVDLLTIEEEDIEWTKDNITDLNIRAPELVNGFSRAKTMPQPENSYFSVDRQRG